jgi:hypothetical protein
MLAADPVAVRIPPGAVRVSRVETPAKYEDSPFGTPGWEGPSVFVTFRSSRPSADVYRFCREPI